MGAEGRVFEAAEAPHNAMKKKVCGPSPRLRTTPMCRNTIFTFSDDDFIDDGIEPVGL